MHFYAIKTCILCILNAFRTKKVQWSDFKSRSLTTLRTLPRTRKLTMFLAVFHFDLYFLYLHEDFVILYILLYVYYVVWVIQAVLEIFFRIRVLNEHQTGGCMTMRYPPPAPGRHHHTLYNNRYWYVESKGSSLHYHHVRFTEPGHSNRSNYKKPKICNLEV